MYGSCEEYSEKNHNVIGVGIVRSEHVNEYANADNASEIYSQCDCGLERNVRKSAQGKGTPHYSQLTLGNQKDRKKSQASKGIIFHGRQSFPFHDM